MFCFSIQRILAGLLLLCLPLAAYSRGGQELTVSFVPVFAGKELVADQWYIREPSADSLTIETLRFYISGLSFYRNDTLIYKEPGSYHLVDIAAPASGSIPVTLPGHTTFDHIQFNLGIDSITNTSGAMGGDLDPALGMYWTWQSGYINFKLEGKNNKCPARNHRFEFHLGGYRNQDYALQAISLPANATADIRVMLPIDKLLEAINLQQQYAVMIPGREAVTLSRMIAQLFHTGRP